MASAQTVAPPGPPHGQAIEPMQPPKDLPRPQRGDRTRNLDFLFGALKAAPDAESAKQVENRIWALWLASGSDTANLLMTRAKSAIDSNDLDLAVQLLDAIVKIKPDYIEAWNRRATLHYMRKEYAPVDGGHPPGADPRAAPLRRDVGARHDPPGVRR